MMNRHSWISAGAGLAAVAFTLGATAPVRGEPGGDLVGEAKRPKVVATEPVSAEFPADLNSAVEQLSSPDFHIRQTATEQLLTDDRLTLPMIERVLRRPDVQPEAQLRLLQVGRQLFYKTPRAAMGVSFEIRNLRNRVVVTATYEKFESRRLLQEGDMIVEACGIKLHGPTAQPMLMSLIVSHDPGDVIPIVVRRGPEKLALDIPLGKFADLQDPKNNMGVFLPEDRLARGWRIRAAAMAPSTANVVRVSEPAGGWTAPPDQQRRMELAVLRKQSVEGAPQVVGGGMPRAADDLLEEPQMIQQVVMVNGRQQIINMPRGRMFGEDFDSALPPMTTAEELTMLTQAATKYTAELRQLPDPSKLTPNDPAMMIIADKKKSLDLIEKQRQAIEAEVAEAAGAGGKQSAAESTDNRP